VHGIQGIKIGSDELVNLLNKWQRSASKLQLTISLPEVTTILTILLHKVEFPTITVTLVGRDEWSDRIDIHLSGCVLERCEGNEGIKTVVRASWLSWKGREILFAETA
jgi:hypothetical protein